MKARMIRLILVAGLIVFGMPLAAGGASSVIKIGMISDIKSFDPAHLGDPNAELVGHSIYNYLVRFGPGSTEIEPDLATRWETSSDGKVITFHLRKGVNFHKGFGEFTAEDAKFSIERHLDPNVKSRFLGVVKEVEKVEAVGSHTLRIHFKAPNPSFLTNFLAFGSGWMLSKKAVEKFGSKYDFNPVGTGPFIYESYQRGTKVVVTKNQDYYKGPPKLSRVEFIPIPESAVSYAAVQSGDVDLIYTRSKTIYGRAKKNTDLKVMTAPALTVRQLYLNTNRGPMKDVRVRRAIAHAIDRKQLLVHVLGNTGIVGDSILNPNHFGYTNDIKQYPFDPARAKKLLSEAGFPNGFEMTFVYPLIPPDFELAPAIAGFLGKVGIKVKLEGVERVAFHTRVGQGGYDMLIIGLTRPPDPDNYLTVAFYSPNRPPGQNHSYYGNADKLIERARVELDRARRKEIYINIQKMAAEDMPTIPIYYPYSIAVMRKNVKGHVVGIFNFWDIYPMSLD